MPDLFASHDFLVGLGAGAASLLAPTLLTALVANKWFRRILVIANALEKGEIDVEYQAAKSFLGDLKARYEAKKAG